MTDEDIQYGDYPNRLANIVTEIKLRALAMNLSYDTLVPEDKRVYSWMHLSTDIEPDQIVHRNLTQRDVYYIQLGKLIRYGAAQNNSNDGHTYEKILSELVGAEILADIELAHEKKRFGEIGHIVSTLADKSNQYGIAGIHENIIEYLRILPDIPEDEAEEGITQETKEEESRTAEGIESLFASEPRPVSEDRLERGIQGLLDRTRRYIQSRL